MTTTTIFNTLRYQKKISALLIVTVLMWAVGLPLLIQRANAAGVTFYSDTISDSDLGMPSNHTIRFTMSDTGQLIAGENFTITLQSGFVLPDNLNANDFDLKVGGVDQNVATTSASGVWGVSVATTTRVITFSSNNTTISTSTAVMVLIGTNATSTLGAGPGTEQITNPGTEGSYTVILGGTMDDSGQTRVAIINDVSVTASVDTTFTFNIYGVATNTSPITGESATTSASTTPTSIPFGTLVGGQAKLAAQRLTVSTNAVNGFSVTIQQDSNLLSASTADIDPFIDGTATSTPTAWQPPSGAGNEDTYGHYGITSEDDDFAGSTDPFGSGLYVGRFTAANPLEIFYHDSVANATGEGETYVAIKIEVTGLQEAATDYSNTLTYIATPVF